MTKKPSKISDKSVKRIGDKLGIDWDKNDIAQFKVGLQVELEHGTKLGKTTDITHNDLVKTGKIALAHLMELPDYYTRLKKVEANNPKEAMNMNRWQQLAGIIKEQAQVGETEDRKKLFVLVGPPSVGKSTWVANTFDTPPYVIDRDSIVEQVAEGRGWTYDDMFVTPPADAEIGSVDPKYGEVVPAPPWMGWSKTAFKNVLDANSKVHGMFMAKVGGAVPSNNNVVVDMTNMNAPARKQAIKAVEGGDYEKIAVVFEFAGVEDIIQSVSQKRAEAAKRMGKSKTISPAVFARMFQSFSRPSKSEGFDQIVSVDNRELLKKLANGPMEEVSMNFESNRWQRLAGILKEQTKLDVSPETLEPRREEEEEWFGNRGEDNYEFQERLPPGHEDFGFNAVVINDIGEELLNIKADQSSLRKAEILHKRLGRAIEALKVEMGNEGSIGEAVGSNDSVDGPYTETTDGGKLEETGKKYPATASEYATELNNRNPENQFKLASDQEHWAKYGVNTGEELARYLAIETYIDLYKDLYNIKPRHMNWDGYSTEEIQQMVDDLSMEASSEAEINSSEEHVDDGGLDFSLPEDDDDYEKYYR